MYFKKQRQLGLAPGTSGIPMAHELSQLPIKCHVTPGAVHKAVKQRGPKHSKMAQKRTT